MAIQVHVPDGAVIDVPIFRRGTLEMIETKKVFVYYPYLLRGSSFILANLKDQKNSRTPKKICKKNFRLHFQFLSSPDCKAAKMSQRQVLLGK